MPGAEHSFDAGRLRTGLEVIANQLGKRLDEDSPRLQAQLPDGSRIAAWIPPLVSPAPAIAIRKFTSRNYTVNDLIARGTLTQAIADLLIEGVPIDDVATMLEVRRRFEIPIALCRARAREIAQTAQRMIARRKVA